MILVVTFITGLLSALHAGPFARALDEQSDPVAHDKAVWEAIRERIEAIDESEQYIVGVELLRASLEDYQTVPFRQRTMFSVGRLYSENGEEDSAIEFLSQAVKLDPSTEDARLAAYFCAELLNRRGDSEAAFEILESVKPEAESGEQVPSRTTDYFVRIREAELVQDESRIEESLDLLRELLDEFPQYSAEILNVATAPASHYFIAEQYQQALDHVEMVEKLFPEFAELAEVASTKVVYARELDRETGTKLAQQFVEQFPDHSHTVGYLMYLAGAAVDEGQAEEATGLFTRALNHPKATSDHKAIIEKNIGNIKGWQDIQPGSGVEPPSGSRGYLIAANLVGLILVIALVLYRRSKSTAQ